MDRAELKAKAKKSLKGHYGPAIGVLLVLGILTACMAGFITKKIRKTKKINPSDKIYLVLKAFALLLVMASLISMIVE